MIQRKIAAAAESLAAEPTLVVTLYPTQESPGYVDTPTNWTLDELQWLLARAHVKNPASASANSDGGED